MARRCNKQRDCLRTLKNGLAKSRAVKASHGIFTMVRIWMLVAGLVLGTAVPVVANDEKSAAGEEHHDAAVKLSERQGEAGKFTIDEGRGGAFRKRISGPGAVGPRGDPIARGAGGLVGPGGGVRKRLGG